MSSWFFDAFKDIVQTAADLAGGVERLVLGVDGSTMVYPTEPEILRRTQETGQAWDGFFLEDVFGGLGTLLDKYRVSWAWVSTNDTGVVPTLVAGLGFSTASKNETSNSLTMTFSPAYGSNYVACYGAVFNVASMERVTNVSSSYAVFEWYDDGGSIIGINNRVVMIICVGQAA